MGTSGNITRCITILSLLIGSICFWQGQAIAKDTGKQSVVVEEIIPITETLASKKSPKTKKRKHSRAEIKKIHAPIRITLKQYRRRIQRHLAKHKLKPGRGLRGNVVLFFTILKSGTVANLRLIRSSGNKKIDRAALAMVIYASPFPRIPRNGPGRMKFSVPIKFR